MDYVLGSVPALNSVFDYQSKISAASIQVMNAYKTARKQ
jgi:hypothetical protein